MRISKRLPLVGAYNTRPATPALTGASAIAGVGVAGIAIAGQANTGSTKDFRLINFLQLTDVDKIAGTKQVYVDKRPGFVTSFTPANGSLGNSIYAWSGNGSKIMSCFGNTNSTLYDLDVSKGSITGIATGITETTSSGSPVLTLTSSNNTAWTFSANTLAQITTSTFPGNAGRMLAGTFAHLDGYAVIMDSEGRIYNSGLNTTHTWASSAYLTANAIPDKGVGAVRAGQHIIGFCKTHYEVFRNAGNPTGSVLSRIDEFTKPIGATSADAITMAGEIVYWAGVTNGANVSIYSYNNGQVKVVSTPEINQILTMSGTAGISLTTVGFYGRHFIVVSATSYTFVYCVEEDNWHEWSGTNLWYKAASVSVDGSVVCYTISRTSTAGRVWVLNPQLLSYQDNGSAFTAILQAPKFDAGTNKRKFYHRIDVIGDRQTATSNLSIQWYDDDYQNLSTARTVDLSGNRPFISRCGASFRRSFYLSHSANTACRLEALEIEAEVGVT